MTGRIFIFDTEATSPSPKTGLMTEVALVDARDLHWFYLHLYPFTPHPDIPARPVVADGAWPEVYSSSGDVRDGKRKHTGTAQHATIAEGLEALTSWVHDVAGGQRPVLMSDNPAFDFMWLICCFDEQGLDHPFGYSARRIGDLAAGLSGNWLSTSRWKRLRVTEHTHDPVDDAMGNAEALRTLLTENNQRL